MCVQCTVVIFLHLHHTRSFFIFQFLLFQWTCVHDIQDREDDDILTENEDLPSIRDDSDDVVYDDEDIDHRGFRGFPNPNYNSTSDSDDSDLE